MPSDFVEVSSRLSRDGLYSISRFCLPAARRAKRAGRDSASVQYLSQSGILRSGIAQRNRFGMIDSILRCLLYKTRVREYSSRTRIFHIYLRRRLLCFQNKTSVYGLFSSRIDASTIPLAYAGLWIPWLPSWINII